MTPETSLIMKVHRSNFDMVGFTADVPIQDLAKLGKENNIPVMNDLGSGSLVDLSGYGIKREPTVPGLRSRRDRRYYIQRRQAAWRPSGRDYRRKEGNHSCH